MKAINAEGIKSSLTDDGSIADTINTLIEIIEDQQQRIEDLEDRLDEEQTQRGKDDAELRSRVSDLERRIEDETPTPNTEESPSQHTETPLQRVCGLPETAVSQQLTANQRRARFVARDIEQYASKVPAGYAITSGEISTVLRAGTDCKGRTETVSRVMDFLDELGKGGVKVVKRRGIRRIVFDEGLVEALQSNHTGCDPIKGATP